MEVTEIVENLNSQLGAVAKHLLPGGREVGREWECGSIHGENGRSMKLCLQGAKKGRWSDFATGESGDVLDLWAATKGLSLSAAIQEAKAFLGVTDPVFVKSKNKTFRKPQPKGAKKAAAESPVMKYLTLERKLTPETIAAYRIAECAEIGPWEGWKRQEPWKGPWVAFPSFRNGELLSMKYLHLERRDGKKQTLVEAGCEPTCFGWQVVDPMARAITICEGEIDALSLHQYGYTAVSVPFGAGKGEKQQWVDYDWNELERFETINLCMDNDEEGAKAVEELVSRLGVHRCRIITLPLKDANECLQKGVSKAQVDASFEAGRYIEPEELKSAREYTQDVIDRFYPVGGQLPGFDMPWPKVPFRFLRGEVTVITGSNGHGKSLLWGQVMMNGVFQSEKICVASLEMKPGNTLYRMARQFTGKMKPSKKKITETMDYFADKVWLFALVGTAKVDRLLEVFEYAYRRHGVKQFVIDSMMKLGLAEDDYNGQKAIMERLCDWVNVTGAHVHLIAHPRKEDEDVPAKKMAIKGTGAITDLAFNVFSVWRNKPKEEALQEYEESKTLPKGKSLDDYMKMPDALLVCSKSRNVEGAEGKYGLWFHPDSLQYHNCSSQYPIDYHEGLKGYFENQYSYSGGLPE